MSPSVWFETPASALHDRVAQAWKEALNVPHCEPSQSWQDGGGDSLATLNLLLKLERSCGRALPFDVITPEMRLADLVALLKTGIIAEPAALLTMHLLPGIHGDGPGLAAFRRALAGHMSFDVVEIADLHAPARVLGDMRLTGEVAACAIARQQPSGPILLAGFSFGGGVAYEAARALIDNGREVAFLGILDTTFGIAATGAKRTLRQFLGWKLRSMLRYALSCERTRSALLKASDRLSWSAAHRVHSSLQDLFRMGALHGWTPAPLAVEVFLAVSEEFAPRTLPIWRRLCARLDVVELPGLHSRILKPPAVDQLIAAFAQRAREAPGFVGSGV
jgi:acetoacetyl-CoA synthetase